MRKSLVKLFVFFCTFLLALVIFSKLMNKGHDNLTMEMAPATLPMVTMVMDGMEYNQLHGVTAATDIAFQRDTVTILGKNRNTGFIVDTYGQDVIGVFIEVRTIDGERLIENSEVSELTREGDQISGNIALKDLIEKDREYALAIYLALEGGQAAYYTRILWSDNVHGAEKLGFCIDFHEKLYDREAAAELAIYLETNARLEDNSSFHKVNIHSSFRQMTWGNLDVAQVGDYGIQLTEIAEQTASLRGNYVVSTSEGKNTTWYMVEEIYRLRYTVDRMYLLDYERTMTQIPDAEQMCANDKLLLGITGMDVPLLESDDGNIVVFQVANRLFSYDVVSNRLVQIFSFYDKEHGDARTIYAGHKVKALNVGEGGNVQFAVYGYMNRGRHEGEVGVQIYTYNGAQNTIEELVYIPYHKTHSILAAEMEQLLYLNREQKLYLILDQVMYRVDLAEKTYSQVLEIKQDGGLLISEDNRIAVWADGEDSYHSTELYISNLGDDTQKKISAAAGESICPLGFMGEDIIYGVAYTKDIREESSGGVFFPMYKICIRSASGELLKEYAQKDIYVTACTVSDNQITLDRVRRLESGEYQEVMQDHIMNNAETETGRNMIVAADTDKYERYVEIQTRKTIDSKSVKIMTPKEVVYEGGRRLLVPEEEKRTRYYVYDAYGVSGIYTSPAGAVDLAYSSAGVVVSERGECIWLRGNRMPRNQILAIKEASATEEQGALAVCINAMLGYRGISRNTQEELDEGRKAAEILQKGLDSDIVMDLTGCSLDAVLYFVNRDIPVLVLLEDGSGVVLVGFNENSVGIMNPQTGTIYRMGMNDAKEWFEQNGNQFITYRSL